MSMSITTKVTEHATFFPEIPEKKDENRGAHQ
jgi:hypothetical protein